MSDYINKYASPAGYAAGASSRPADASSVSAVGAAVEFDGINVVIPIASRRAGDHLFLDKATGKKVAVRGGTLRRNLLDASRYVNLRNVFLGRVAGKNIFLDYTQTAAKRFATGDEWTLSGFDFSVAGSAELLFKYYSASAADGQKLVELSWESGGNIDSLVATINGTAGLKTYCSAVKIDSTTIGVTVNGYSSAIGIVVNSGSITATRTYQGYQYRQYTADPRAVSGVTTIVRHNGAVEGSGFACFDKMYDYYYTNGKDTTEALNGSVIKYSAFNETTNPELYAMFGGDYVAYMQAKYDQFRAEYPCNRLAMGQMAIGDGSTSALAAVSHVDFLGNLINDFPNAADAIAVGVSVENFETGCEPGTGHLGGIAEALLLYRLVKRGQDDVINVSLKEGAGTVVNYGTYTRLAFQSYASYAWIFNGNYGYLSYGSSRIYAYAARVFRALSDQDLEL